MKEPLHQKIKNIATTWIQCWTEFRKSLPLLHFFFICFSERHIQKGHQKQNVTLFNACCQTCSFISLLKTSFVIRTAETTWENFRIFISLISFLEFSFPNFVIFIFYDVSNLGHQRYYFFFGKAHSIDFNEMINLFNMLDHLLTYITLKVVLLDSQSIFDCIGSKLAPILKWQVVLYEMFFKYIQHE